MVIINHFRRYQANATMGDLYINGRFVGFTLEDVGRPLGVKHHDETCIPEGVYTAQTIFSPTYNKFLVGLRDLDSPHDEVKSLGVSFSGIRVHGGNDVDDTSGCVILGSSSNGVDKVWDCAKVNRELVDQLHLTSGIRWVISSLK